jgi:long-subunit acyl-CoA synthetase (AMP-forming)
MEDDYFFFFLNLYFIFLLSIILHPLLPSFPFLSFCFSLSGEILVHSASLFKGYFVIQPDPEKPDPDALAFVSLGEEGKQLKYYKTGDVGQIDDDGYGSGGSE